MEEIRENWQAVRHRVQHTVDLTGPADVKVPGTLLHSRRRYRITRVLLMFDWQGDGETKTFVTLTCREIRDDGSLGHRDGRLFQDQLVATPDWLESIITRAMPRRENG
jgi:hypothetical protein